MEKPEEAPAPFIAPWETALTSVIDEMKRTLDSKVREVETLINF